MNFRYRTYSVQHFDCHSETFTAIYYFSVLITLPLKYLCPLSSFLPHACFCFNVPSLFLSVRPQYWEGKFFILVSSFLGLMIPINIYKLFQDMICVTHYTSPRIQFSFLTRRCGHRYFYL